MERRKDTKGRVLQKGESQRKDGLYVFQYKDISGKRRSAYASDLSDLRKKERKIRMDLEDNINTSGAEITLNEQFDKYMSLKTRLRNTTRQTYFNLWNNNIRNNEIGKKKLCDIKKSDIIRFYNSLSERGLKYSTMEKFEGMLSPCLELAVDDDILRKNPCRGCLEGFQKDASEKTILTGKEQVELLDFVRQSRVYYIRYPMIVFMLGTAVRCGEMIGLTWNDVDFKKMEISINHQLIYGKTDKTNSFYAGPPKTDSGMRTIPMTKEVCRALKEQRETQLSLGWKTNVKIGTYDDFVFSTKRNTPITPSGVNGILSNIVNKYNSNEENKIKLPHISAHTLRHTGCTRMAEAGMDPKVLQYIMGHSKISVTMEVYNHATKERNKKEMEKMERLRMIM